MGSATTVQQTFRFREDDGSETGATWLGAGNGADISRGTGTGNKVRLRVITEETNGGNANVPWILYASYKGGAYFQVTTSTSYVQMVASGYVSDGVATTAQLGYSGTFDDGYFDSNGAQPANTALLSEYTEMEYCFYVVDADVANDDTIDFRVYESAGAPCDSYVDTPRLTVVKGGGTVSFTATAAGATTTPADAALAVARALSAAAAGATTTPSAVLALTRALAATAAGATTTPSAVLAVARPLSAAAAGTTATPDDAILALARALAATAAGATTTPDAALAIARALVATAAGATATPDDVELTLAGIIAFAATAAGATTTPDDAALAVARAMAAAAAGATTTPDAALALARALAATATGATTTPDAVLAIGRQLAATAAGATTTPDDVTLTVMAGQIIAFAATAAGVTTTPAAALAVARAMAATAAGQTTTPDDATLLVGMVMGLVVVLLSAQRSGVGWGSRTPGATLTGRAPGAA